MSPKRAPTLLAIGELAADKGVCEKTVRRDIDAGRLKAVRVDGRIFIAKNEAHRTICRFVFHRKGKRIKTFRKAWATACEDAGYPCRILHDLRRSAVRNMERHGLSRSVAMQLTGHKTESVYRRYAITSEADLREGVDRLNTTTNRSTKGTA